MTDAELHEIFVLWPAFQLLHGHLLTTDARTADPHDLAGPIRWYGLTRAACLLHAHAIGNTLTDSATLAGHILAMCEHGKRPRYGAELGLSIKDFER